MHGVITGGCAGFFRLSLNDAADPKDIDTSVVAYLWFNPAFALDDDKDAEIDVLRYVKSGLAPRSSDQVVVAPMRQCSRVDAIPRRSEHAVTSRTSSAIGRPTRAG